MQLLFRQGQYNPYRNTNLANSPLHLALAETDELRSKLFPERRRIPGRKGKIFLALGIAFQIYGCFQIAQIRRQFKRKDLELKKLQRKATPFLQAMADIRYCAVKDKGDILIKELFAHKGQQYIDDITNIYFQKDIWVPFKNRVYHQGTRICKDPSDYTDLAANRLMHGYDLHNI